MAAEQLVMEIRDGARSGQRVMRLEGALTLQNLFQFQAAWRAEEAATLIFDLSSVPYIDSAAIGSLVNAHVSRQKTGKRIAVAGVVPRVKETLRITHVDNVLPLFESVAAAEASADAAGS